MPRFAPPKLHRDDGATGWYRERRRSRLRGTGLATLVVGLDRFRRLLEWWLAKGPGFWRVWGAVVLGLALLLACTIAPWWR